jgi:hypothetical protein
MIDFLEAPWTLLRPLSGHPVRVEDFVRDGHVRSVALPAAADERHIQAT